MGNTSKVRIGVVGRGKVWQRDTPYIVPQIRKGSSLIKILKKEYRNNVSRRSGSSCSDYSKEGDTTKKAKIGITIKVVMIIRMEMMMMMSRRVAKRQRLSSPSRFDDNKRLLSPPFQKSPNSDRTFESRLLDSEFDDQTPPTIKNKMLDLKVKHLLAPVLAPELRHQYYFSTMYYL